MFYEQTQNFYKELCKKTYEKKLNWLPLSEFNLSLNMFNDLLSIYRNYQTEINFNHSFFIKKNTAYLFLISIDIIDEYTSKLTCKKHLLAKPDKDMLPINITSHLDNEDLTILFEKVEEYMASLHVMPDTLYHFFYQILETDFS